MTSLLILVLIAQAGAQSSGQATQAPTASSATEWKIVDNSFLVEEAFNQDPGVVQNIFQYTRQQGAWVFTYTQEWPVPGVRHQLSYTIPVQGVAGQHGPGDVLINYRLQVLEEGPGRPAFAPRVSAILPSGSEAVGAGSSGLQVNLPFSKHRDNLYVHGNAGFTWQKQDGVSLLSPAYAGSAIYRVRDMVNVMLESVLLYPASSDGGHAHRSPSFTLSPGIRGGWNVTDDKQVIIGAAIPVTRGNGRTNAGVLAYFSYEGPVKGLPKKNQSE